MNVITTKTAGNVIDMSPRSGLIPRTLAASMTAAIVPPPWAVLTALKFVWKSVAPPRSRTANARNVPTDAMIQKTFCQRKVVRVPAMSTSVRSRIIEKPPMNVQTLSVWNRVPHSVSTGMLNSTPRLERTGPSARTAKYRAQNVAPIRAESAAPKLETRASGGDRMRLTQT